MRYQLPLVLVASLLVVAVVQQDWTIVPGTRVGPITPQATEKTLVSLFGQANVATARLQVFEDQTELGTVLFPSDSTRRLEILWQDGATRRFPARISLAGNESLWRTASGVTLGLTLAELERLNGGPFELRGDGFDGSGTVLNWKGGALAHLLDEPGIRLRLWPPVPVVGETVESSLPSIRAANPRIHWIDVFF